MDLSVIIPCYNNAAVVGAQLDALATQTWSGTWEVIVADNGSDDESAAVVESYRQSLPMLRTADASAHRSQPYALNVGARASRGAAVAFVDADDVVAPGWVAAMGDALTQHDFVASRHDMVKLNAAWLVAVRGQPQRDGLQIIWYPPYLPHAGGCGLGMKRWLFEAVQGFDEALPYLHDTDFCFRAQLAGVPLRFVGNATVYIRCRSDLNSVFHQARCWAEYNDLVYKRYRGDLVVGGAWRRYLRDWLHLARGVRSLHDKHRLWSLAWQAGWQVGLLVGSVKYRVAPAVRG